MKAPTNSANFVEITQGEITHAEPFCNTQSLMIYKSVALYNKLLNVAKASSSQPGNKINSKKEQNLNFQFSGALRAQTCTDRSTPHQISPSVQCVTPVVKKPQNHS